MNITLDEMLLELKRLKAKENSIKSRVLIQNAIDALRELKEKGFFKQ